MVGVFTDEIVGWALEAQRVYQIPASLNLSAAKLESDLGKETPPGTNNWHGIKDPHGVGASTREQRPDGSWYTLPHAGFRVFATPADSFMYYGHLLGLATPYNAMVTEFLRSLRGPADVVKLSHALTGVYATAKAYGDTLVAIQRQYDLYQYDDAAPNQKGTTPVTNPIPSAPPAPDPTPATTPVIVAPAPTVPSVKQTALDVGDALEVLWKLADAAAEAGVSVGLSLLPPQLRIITMFFTPTVIQGYIHSAFAQLEAASQGRTVNIDTSNALVAMVVANINANEKLLVQQLDSLEAWVEPMVVKFLAGLTPKA